MALPRPLRTHPGWRPIRHRRRPCLRSLPQGRSLYRRADPNRSRAIAKPIRSDPPRPSYLLCKPARTTVERGRRASRSPLQSPPPRRLNPRHRPWPRWPPAFQRCRLPPVRQASHPSSPPRPARPPTASRRRPARIHRQVRRQARRPSSRRIRTLTRPRSAMCRPAPAAFSRPRHRPRLPYLRRAAARRPSVTQPRRRQNQNRHSGRQTSRQAPNQPTVGSPWLHKGSRQSSASPPRMRHSLSRQAACQPHLLPAVSPLCLSKETDRRRRTPRVSGATAAGRPSQTPTSWSRVVSSLRRPIWRRRQPLLVRIRRPPLPQA